ncbi:unnamed protein product [Didymodactylos carnosus]|uniref:DUF4105 domain-containing protein n=1 Tax=Didymodactylos carnosus TaxID=1234261 RepID=A0A814Y1N5_9BILA|nr:unnamed protein product [Didymodactylos carnosus]CAF3986637.1 unnamed protein product [Didymodactylos carnosus]
MCSRLDPEIERYCHETSSSCRNGNAVVHFWEFRSVKEVGHVSLTLPNQIHISFWPLSRTKQCIKDQADPIKDQTLLKDIEFENRLPKKKVLIPSSRLDETRVVPWWENYLKEKKYDLFDNNCAMVVLKALNAGGFTWEYKTKSLPYWGLWSMSQARALAIRDFLNGKLKEAEVLLKPCDAYYWIVDGLTEWPDVTLGKKIMYNITDPKCIIS